MNHVKNQVNKGYHITNQYGKLVIYSAYLENAIKSHYKICEIMNKKISKIKNIKSFINSVIEVLEKLPEETYTDNIFYLLESLDAFEKRNKFVHSSVINHIYEGKYKLSSRNGDSDLNLLDLENLISDIDDLTSKVKIHTLIWLKNDLLLKIQK